MRAFRALSWPNHCCAGSGGNQALEIYVDTFQGRAAVVRLLTGRKFTHERRDAWFDVNGRQLALKLKDVESLSMKLDCGLRREVVAIAEAVSAGMSSLRIDFLVTAEGPRVVELTAYPCAGRALWEKPEMDEMMGHFFDSPDSSFIPSFARKNNTPGCERYWLSVNWGLNRWSERVRQPAHPRPIDDCKA